MRIVELQGNSKGIIIVSHFEKLRKREKVIFWAKRKLKLDGMVDLPFCRTKCCAMQS